MVGEIVDVQVVWQKERREIGKAVIKVHEVLAGHADGSLAIFPYDRRLFGGLDPMEWDMVEPVKGKKLILYFRERGKDGTYGLSQSILHPQYELAYLGDAHDDPKVRELFETADKDKAYYILFGMENSVQKIRSFDDPEVQALRKLTGHSK